MKECRKRRIMISRSGSGSYDYKISFPISWMEEMGIDTDEREVYVSYDGTKITIEKKENNQ